MTLMFMFCLNVSAMEIKNSEEKLIKADKNIEKKEQECFFVKTKDGYRLFNYDSKKYNPEIVIKSGKFNREYKIFVPLIEKGDLSEKNFSKFKLTVGNISGEISDIYRVFNLESEKHREYCDKGPEAFEDYEIERIEKEPKNLLREDLSKFVDDMKDLFFGLKEYKLLSVEDRLKKANEKIADANQKIFDFFNKFVGEKVLIKDE